MTALLQPVVMRAPLAWTERAVGEAEYQAALLQLAHAFGWRSYHPYFSVGSRAGFPDCFFWHPERRASLFVEVKRENGRLSPAQRDCQDSMRAAGLDVRVWRPSDWDEAVSALSFGRAVAP